MSEPETPDFVSRTGSAFLARRLYQLADIIAEQGEGFLADLDVPLGSRYVSVIHLLRARHRTSIADIAEALGLSHQLCTQRITALKAQGFVRDQRDPDDGRKLQLILTDEGLVVADKLAMALVTAEQTYADLFEEIGVDLFAATSDAMTALTRRSLQSRIKS